jgi:cbb3-type cytochrome oxidase subunit 3
MILVISISGGIVLVLFITLVFIYVFYYGWKTKKRQKNLFYSKRHLFDEDGDLNAFYSNKDDFVG